MGKLHKVRTVAAQWPPPQQLHARPQGTEDRQAIAEMERRQAADQTAERQGEAKMTRRPKAKTRKSAGTYRRKA